MRISELLAGLPANIEGDASVAVQGMESDSRNVQQGDLFVALEGYSVDGHTYADQALARGAVALLVEDAGKLKAIPSSVPVAELPDLAASLSFLADRFYGSPSSSLSVIGITGTNGKTSSAFFAKKILETAGQQCGLIGTINYMIGDLELPAPNTTPDALTMQKLLANMRDAGLDSVVMEVSSHALALGRVDAVHFDVGVLTNISEDHLDFHGNMDNYVQAKLLLLDRLSESRKEKVTFCYNRDTAYRERVEAKIKECGVAALGFGIDGEGRENGENGKNGENGDWRAEEARAGLNETSFQLVSPFGREQVRLESRGYFSISNALAAITATAAVGVGRDALVNGCREVRVPGRFELVPGSDAFLVVVDYAHTDDALKNLLEAARRLNPRRILTVFGCGGDRDTKKRPLMAGVAEKLSDKIFITNDNPRSEDPEKIIQDIVAGLKKPADETALMIIPDRATAIEQALREAEQGDIVLIAGKGHEDYQIFSDRTIHFSDRETAREVLERL